MRERILDELEQIPRIRIERRIRADDLKEVLLAKGYEKVCIWCGTRLSGRKRTMCSDLCWHYFATRCQFDYLRRVIVKERKKVCEECNQFYRNSEKLQVHHKLPISRGGKTFDRDNLILLCTKCHGKAHRIKPSSLEDKNKNMTSLDRWL